jgi:hypothetical protein
MVMCAHYQVLIPHDSDHKPWKEVEFGGNILVLTYSTSPVGLHPSISLRTRTT